MRNIVLALILVAIPTLVTAASTIQIGTTSTPPVITPPHPTQNTVKTAREVAGAATILDSSPPVTTLPDPIFELPVMSGIPTYK